MSKQVINIGSTANDSSGDSLRDAGQKINANFTELYNTSGLDTTFTQAAFDKANSAYSLAGTGNLGYLKINGNTLGTVDTPGGTGWGGYWLYLDPNGEGWSGISIPSLSAQQSGSALQIYNNHRT
jgi:hypothetical protein